MFSNDWQFDCILFHSDTLKGLYLDHCSIMYQIWHANSAGLDPAVYPVYDEHILYWGWSRDSIEQNINKIPKLMDYKTRWHDVFTRFRPRCHTWPRLVSVALVVGSLTPSTATMTTKIAAYRSSHGNRKSRWSFVCLMRYICIMTTGTLSTSGSGV